MQHTNFSHMMGNILIIITSFCSVHIVSGDANFAMSSTQLTVGSFTQPGVARGLIEMPANSEKGFSHRFLWFFPNTLFEKFSSLGEVDRQFVQKISTL